MDNKIMVNNIIWEVDNGIDFLGRVDFILDGIIIGIVVNIFLIFLILGGNFLVIVVYFKNFWFWIGIYVLLVSLVLFDLFVGGVVILIWIYGFINSWDVSVIFVLVYNVFDIFSVVVFNFYFMVIFFECFIVVLWLFYY